MLWWKNLQLLQLQLQQLQERWSKYCHLANLQGPHMPSVWYVILWASERTFSPHESKASSTLWVCLMQRVVDIEQWWVFGPVRHDLLHLEPYSWRGESLRVLCQIEVERRVLNGIITFPTTCAYNLLNSFQDRLRPTLFSQSATSEITQRRAITTSCEQ